AEPRRLDLRVVPEEDSDSPRAVLRPAGVAAPPARAVVQEREPVNLYDVGKSMGGQVNERKYAPVESIGETGVRSISIGRDFAMGASPSPYPDANRIESGLREEDSKKKYTTEMESGGKGKSKRYAWDV
ncbi:MAG: hypothetical protein KKD18_03665, partial [Nanoarchaeota archaeon]|nr:hypothetical protein [Nanoarchaeota archaeon]